MRTLARAASLALLLAAVACGSTQPSGNAATISGTVTDAQSRAPISAAAVTIQTKATSTAANGSYTISGLTAGGATLTVQHQGHDTATQQVTLAGGKTTTTDVALTPALASALTATWAGVWHNDTFGTTGAATLTGSADTIAQTFQSTLTLGGSVFGQSSAPPLSLGGAYTPSAGAVNIAATSLFFGNLTLTVSPAGLITGSLTNVPVGGISRVDFNGTSTATSITVNYTITFTAGGTATGTLALAKP